MTDPVLLLDSTVLVAYKRDLTWRAQALMFEALTDGRLMVTAALSLAVACAEMGGATRELAWLIYDRDGPLSVLPLALGAMEVGTAASGAKTAGELESRRSFTRPAPPPQSCSSTTRTATSATALTWSTYAHSTPVPR